MFFFFNDTATTEIYTSFPTRRSSDLAAHLRARHPREVQEVVYEKGHASAGGAYAPHVAAALSVELDRKSTRLNSSHANISYAVFCLKKKKTVTARRPPRL